jgi:hypothetical protein
MNIAKRLLVRFLTAVAAFLKKTQRRLHSFETKCLKKISNPYIRALAKAVLTAAKSGLKKLLFKWLWYAMTWLFFFLVWLFS